MFLLSPKHFLPFVVFLQQALSNVHSVRATVTDKDPLTWNFNPKVLPPIITLQTLYRGMLVIRLRRPSFLPSILSYKGATHGEVTCINPRESSFCRQSFKRYLDYRKPMNKSFML